MKLPAFLKVSGDTVLLAVQLVRGQTSRQKMVAIRGLTGEVVWQRLSEA